MGVNEGDIIRVLNIPKEYTEHTYVGAICEVLGVHDSGITVSAPIPNGYGGSQFLVYIAEGDYEVITEEDDSMTNTKAQVGDLIRIVNPFEGASDPYTIGDILEVTRRRNDSDVFALFKGVEETVADREYVIHRKKGEEDSSESVKDAVVQPSHYTNGKFETIEVIEEITGGYDDGFSAYNIGNVLKYIARAPFKHATPVEDLRKASRYLDYAIAHEQRKINGK